MNFRNYFPFDPHFNIINKLNQRSAFGNVLAFAHTDKELQRKVLLAIYGNSCSGVVINCIKNYQSLNTNRTSSSPWFSSTVQRRKIRWKIKIQLISIVGWNSKNFFLL